MSNPDSLDIIGVINLYALAIDTQRWELLDCVFTLDARADYNPASRWSQWSDLATLKRDFAAFHDPLDGSQHTVTNHQVIVDGDHANALSYVVVRLIRKMSEGENFFQMGGWYDDRLVRTRAGWRIKTRVFRGNWWEGNLRIGGGELGERFEPDTTLMRRAAAAGTMEYLDALAKRPP
jgi:hypothetical protein